MSRWAAKTAVPRSPPAATCEQVGLAPSPRLTRPKGFPDAVGDGCARPAARPPRVAGPGRGWRDSRQRRGRGESGKPRLTGMYRPWPIIPRPTVTKKEARRGGLSPEAGLRMLEPPAQGEQPDQPHQQCRPLWIIDAASVRLRQIELLGLIFGTAPRVTSALLLLNKVSKSQPAAGSAVSLRGSARARRPAGVRSTATRLVSRLTSEKSRPSRAMAPEAA